MARDVPTFGSAPAARVVDRAAAYAVVLDAADRAAVVRGPTGRLFLLGGGAHPNETPRETVEREVREESGCVARELEGIGEAIQYFESDGGVYRMCAHFFTASLGEKSADAEAEHEVLWVSPQVASGGFFHACHTWALERVLANRAALP